MTRKQFREIVKTANTAARTAGPFGTQEWSDAYQAVLDSAGCNGIAPQPRR